jgi:dienelactone hydrolase
LRLDARGWGRSPLRWGVGRPYDQSMVEDATDVLIELRSGVEVLGIAGLCAGAWIALDVARRLDVDQVVAVNPQLYWEPGDPVEARIADTIARREPAALAIAGDREIGRWDREDAAGLRNRAGEWLDDLALRSARISLVFTGADPGLRYLRDRLAARLVDVQARADVQIIELPDLDHGLQRTWLRPQLAAAVLRAWRTAPAGGSVSAGQPR